MRQNSKGDIIIHFEGQLHFDDINDLIQILKEEMKVRKVSFGIYKKVLMLMIESLENILRYKKQINRNYKKLELHPEEFIIFLQGDNFTVKSSNAVLNTDIPELEKKLTYLNKLSKQQIKELYKSTITDGKFSDKGGAGLGIIEMAKISDKKFKFSFSPLDEKLSYFTICMLVRMSSKIVSIDNT